MTEERMLSRDVVVRIVINDRHGVLDRYLPGGELHGQHPYAANTEELIFEHLFYNAVSNGVTNVNALDGWADLADDAATMEVVGVGI